MGWWAYSLNQSVLILKMSMNNLFQMNHTNILASRELI